MIQTAPSPPNLPQPDIDSEYDVVIIGAGPAGSTVGALVAEAGQRVLILERASFPRFHLGESLIPETYWTLKRLGLLDQLRKSAFPKKFSVQFVTETGKESAPFYFDEHNDHESSQTWQVVRGEFDQMLLDNACSKGAVARTDAQVLEVLFENETARGVKVQLGHGNDKTTCEIKSKVVVDATGLSTFLANRLGLKQPDKCLRKGTVWSYFKGALRDPGKDEGATIILQTEAKTSWFWYIPLPDDVVSVGCTGDMDFMFNNSRGTPEEIFNEELNRCPGMLRRLENATACTDYLTTKDFSYRSTQAAGPGWVLVGDAFGFIDPVYSSGIYLAFKSGEFVADAINEAFQKNDFSAEMLGNWHEKYLGGLELFKKLVYAFYAPGFSFGKFLMKYPQYKSNLVDILVGDVFKPGVGDMFEAMEEFIPQLTES